VIVYSNLTVFQIILQFL